MYEVDESKIKEGLIELLKPKVNQLERAVASRSGFRDVSAFNTPPNLLVYSLIKDLASSFGVDVTKYDQRREELSDSMYKILQEMT